MVEARHPETGGVPGGLPRGGEVQPRGLEARDAAQALRAAGAQDLRRLRLVGRVVAGGHGARVAARARLRRAQGGPRAHGRRRHRQDAHGVGPLRAGVREEARGALLHGVLARDAPEARPRRREARPGGRAYRQGPPARHRRARVPPARRGRGEAALPGLRRRIREAVGGDHHESGVQQVGVGVRGRPDGRRRDRPHRPPREARPVPRRVLPRPPCPHAGGLAAQKACALPMLRLLNFRCSFCSNPLDETHHISNVGWMGVVADGKTSGVIDSRNAIEALSLSVNWYGHGGSISSRAHVSGIGWQSWSSGTVGTTGQSRSVESVQFKLNDEISATYDIWYRVYASKLGGWLGWTSNGSPAGSVGKGAAIQGIQVMLVEKGCSAPGDTANHFIGATDVLSGSSYGLNGNSLGTVQGKTILMGSESGSEPLTSLSISFDNQETSGSIGYSGCYEFSGWSGVVSDGAALNSKNDGRTLKAVRLTLTGDLSNAYDVWYRCFDSKKGWLGWACNGADAGATIPGSFLKAVEVRIISKGSGAPGVTDGAFVSDTSADCAHIVYQAHSASRGWFPSVLDGQDAGTTGKSLSLQALNVVLAGVDDDSLVEARAHVANIGWQEWRSAGYVGTVGQGLAIQALELRINGPLANQYDIYYRVHSAGYGWLGWAKNGDSAGTTGLNIQIEAVQIKLVAKGGNPGSSSAPAFISAPALTLQAHVATLGWMNPVGNGGVAGTTGRSLAIEALKLNDSSSVSGGIEYSAHVQDVGWQGWTSNGNVAGTVGCAKRIEALKIKLTGDLSNYFDVWYRAYCQDFGWLDWTSNGQPAGTSRIGCRVESVQVKIVPKGAGAPGSTARPFTDQPLLPADMMTMLNRANRYSSSTSWLIMVDRQACRLGVFRGQRGSWSYAQYWTCSTGAPSTPTPTGEYTVTGKGYSFGHGYTCYYYTQFYGDYLFHSIPYYQGTFNSMDSRMGMHVSQGCVRFPIDRAKWIWDNVPLATKVVIY